MKKADSPGKAVGDFGSGLAAVRSRLVEIRYVLVAAFVVAVVLAFTPVGAGWALGVLVLLVAAALLPVRSRLERLADERRRGEAALERESAARDALLDAVDLPAFLLAGDGSLVHANRSAVDLFGPVGHGEHLSSRIRSPEILDMVRETLETFEPSTTEHSERVPSERWYQVRVAPAAGVREGPGDACFLLTFRDVTEARRMDRMRSDFVANASHELRTPLASLTGLIETLQGPAREDPKARDRFLAIMLDQAERMSRLVDDLMSLSRLELRAHVAPSGTVDLRPLLGHVCDTLRPLASDLGIVIRLDAPEGPITVKGERDELIQVFQNLVENACKYGQSGGAVDVAIMPGRSGSDTPEGMVDVAVRDYGPGIAPEHVPRLTERFYRADIETSRSKKGTGLGLAIVKHILTRHRARLMIRSEMGKGSVFVVRFAAV